MQQTSTTVKVFLAGLLTGVVAMILLGIYVRPLYRDLLRNAFIVQQELLSDDKACSGDLLSSVVHRWNAIEAETDPEAWPSLGWGARERDPLFAFQLLRLKNGISRSANPDGQGRRAILGTQRADLAARLELLGYRAAAEQQWEIAREFTGLPEPRLRERAFERLQSLSQTNNCNLTITVNTEGDKP